MAEIQKLICPECKAAFEYDPNSDVKIITAVNKSFKLQKKKSVEVTAYLECPNGHNKPYKVIKEY